MPSVVVPADRSAAAGARRFVERTLRGWQCPDSVVDDALLLVSELVTNAVLHAHSASTVTVEDHGSAVRVTVFDTDETAPALRHHGPDAVTGRGLLLVDRIAKRWGVETAAEGKGVWFEISRAGDRATAS